MVLYKARSNIKSHTAVIATVDCLFSLVVCKAYHTLLVKVLGARPFVEIGEMSSQEGVLEKASMVNDESLPLAFESPLPEILRKCKQNLGRLVMF